MQKLQFNHICRQNKYKSFQREKSCKIENVKKWNNLEQVSPFTYLGFGIGF